MFGILFWRSMASMAYGKTSQLEALSSPLPSVDTSHSTLDTSKCEPSEVYTTNLATYRY